MLQITPQMKILVAVEPADFRKGIDGLAALCKSSLLQDPFAGTVFVFRNRRATAIKVLVYDGQGFWLCPRGRLQAAARGRRVTAGRITPLKKGFAVNPMTRGSSLVRGDQEQRRATDSAVAGGASAAERNEKKDRSRGAQTDRPARRRRIASVGKPMSALQLIFHVVSVF